jgi:hypothetical protein
MFQNHFIGRSVQISACWVAVFLCATPAGGQTVTKEVSPKDKRICKIAYKSAKEREKSSRLREASEFYLACAKATCSAFLKQVCTTRYAQLQIDIPSIVPVVTDERGVTVYDVQVTMDGELLTSRLDGRALPVEPGTHDFSFDTGKGGAVSQKILIVQGQRNRPISVSVGKRGQKSVLVASVMPAETMRAPEPATASEPIAPEKAPARPEAPEGSSSNEGAPEHVSEGPRPKESGPGVLPYLIGATGVAAVGAGTLLLMWGRKDNTELAQCSPSCQPSSVDRVRSLYTAADLSFGVGLAAIGISTYLLATSASSERTPSRAAYAVDVMPTPSGAFATVAGSF